MSSVFDFMNKDKDYINSNEVINEGKYLFSLNRTHVEDVNTYSNLPKSDIGSDYQYVKRQDGFVKEFNSKDEAIESMKSRGNSFLDDNKRSYHDHLFVLLFPVKHSMSNDKYYFRCVECNKVVVLTCQTESQDNAQEFWDKAVESYSTSNKHLVYDLIELFTKLNTRTLLQVVKDPDFKKMVIFANNTSDGMGPELEYLKKKIIQVDPTFEIK